MKKICLITVLFFSCVKLYAQQPSLEWGFKFSSDPSVNFPAEVRGLSIETDASNFVYSRGTVRNTRVDFDPGPDSVFISPALNDQYLFISKTAPNGNLIWIRNFLSNHTPNPSDIIEMNTIAHVVDDNGNVFVTGQFSGLVDFDPGPGVIHLDIRNGAFFILKLNANGNFLWVKQLQIDGANVNAIATDFLGNILLTGINYYTDDDFDPGPGIAYVNFAGGNGSAFILKLGRDGNFKWVKSIGGANYTRGYAITTDREGSVITGGSFPYTADFDPGPGTFYLTATDQFGSITNDGDAYISKLDSSGNFIWAKRIGGAWQDDVIYLKTDRNNNVYAMGQFYDVISLTPNPTNLTLTSNGRQDVFVTKINSAGDFIWAKNFGGVADDALRKFVLDKKNNMILTGQFTGTANFSTSSSTPYNLTATSGQDIYISKLDSSGSLQWAKQMGGNDYPFSDDRAGGIAIDTLDNIYANGFFDGVIDIDPDTSVFNLSTVPYPPPPQAPAFADNMYFFKWSQCKPPATPLINTPSSNLLICKGTSTVLSATGTGNISWYSAATGGTFLGSGNSFTTPVLNSSTTFYIQDSTCKASTSRQAIVVSVKQPSAATINRVACNFYTLNSQTYNSSGTYVQHFTNAVGCDSAVTLNLVINRSVTITRDTSICAEQKIIVGNTIHSTSGIYRDTLTGSNGCDSIMVTNLVVALSINSQISELPVSLIAVNANALYQWANCDNGFSAIAGQTNQEYIPTANGNYALIVKEGLCADTSICINIDRAINSVNIFPNPSSGIFNVVVFNVTGKIDLMLYNNSGQLVFQKLNTGPVNTINITHLAGTVYLLKCISNGKVIAVRKLLKK